MNVVEWLMRFNPVGGSNIVGILMFTLMNAIGAWHFYRRTGNPWHAKLFAMFGGIVATHFFIHLIDMMSIPAQIIRIGLSTLMSVCGYFSLTFWQWFGAEIVVVYTYRKFLNLGNLWLILPIMSAYALTNQFFWGTTSIQVFSFETRMPFYIFSYIPSWILFIVVYWRIFLRK